MDYDKDMEQCKGCQAYFYIEQMERSGVLCKSCAKNPKEAYRKE